MQASFEAGQPDQATAAVAPDGAVPELLAASAAVAVVSQTAAVAEEQTAAVAEVQTAAVAEEQTAAVVEEQTAVAAEGQTAVAAAVVEQSAVDVWDQTEPSVWDCCWAELAVVVVVVGSGSSVVGSGKFAVLGRWADVPESSAEAAEAAVAGE